MNFLSSCLKLIGKAQYNTYNYSGPLGSNNIITILDLYDTSKGDRSKSHERNVSISYKSMVNDVDLILHKVYYHLILVIIRLDSHGLSIVQPLML